MHQNRFRAGSILTAFFAVVLLVLGELPIVGAVWLAKWVVAQSPWAWSEPVKLAVGWSIASCVVALGGYYFFGLPVLKLYEHHQQPRPQQMNDPRFRWARTILQKGQPIGFVLASMVGGALPIAWWYGSHNDRRARSKTMMAAWILGVVATALWFGLFTAQYRLWTLAVIVCFFLAVGLYARRSEK